MKLLKGVAGVITGKWDKIHMVLSVKPMAKNPLIVYECITSLEPDIY